MRYNNTYIISDFNADKVKKNNIKNIIISTLIKAVCQKGT